MNNSSKQPEQLTLVHVTVHSEKNHTARFKTDQQMVHTAKPHTLDDPQ